MSRISMLLAPAFASLIAMLALPAAAAIVTGQVDDFEDGSVQSWEAGSQNPHGPLNVASGGPAGAGDNYLRLASDGFSAGGRLVAFNSGQWAGNYLEAGVSSIRMQVNNLGTTSLALRLILVGAGSLTTVTPVDVAAGSGWTAVAFSLAPENLSPMGSSYAAVLSSVSELNLVHSPSPIGFRTSAPNIVAQLGIDNVTAVPEPTTLWLAILGLAAVLCRAARTLCSAAHAAAG